MCRAVISSTFHGFQMLKLLEPFSSLGRLSVEQGALKGCVCSEWICGQREYSATFTQHRWNRPAEH